MKKALKQSTIILILNLISIVLLLGCVGTFFLSAFFTNKVNQANSDRFELTYNANRFMNGSAYLTNEVRAYAATGNPQHYDNYWDEVNNQKNRDIGVENLKKIGITSEEQIMIDEMSSLSNALVPLEDEAMQNVQEGRMDAAISYVYGEEYESSIRKINQIKSDFLTKLDIRAEAEVNKLIGQNKAVTVLLMVFIVMIIILQVITNRVTKGQLINPVIRIEQEMNEISNGIISSEFELVPDSSEIGMLVGAIHHTKAELKKYIWDITEKLEQMAEGNMNQTVEIEYAGDFVPIRDAMATILDSLNRTLWQINQASAQVDSGSGQMASGAQGLSQGAAEQASSMEELYATVSDLTEEMGRIAENAESAKELSTDAEGVLGVCNNKMHDMLAAMNNMADASGEISKIIGTIEEIASQTNILALNAAVEGPGPEWPEKALLLWRMR